MGCSSVRVANDANVAALGEMNYGAGRGTRDAVMITLGTGVGGGILSGGNLISGIHGAGGEIGHIKVSDPIDRRCGCGKSGCLEQYASATGIVALAKRRLENSSEKTALRSYDELTCKDVFDCAKAGDYAAIQIIDRRTNMLGKALAIVSCVCDPEVYIIGGGVARAGDMILDGVQKHFIEYAFPAASEARFCLATLGNDAGIYGAAELIRSGC